MAGYISLEGRSQMGQDLGSDTVQLDTLGSTVKVSLSGILISTKVPCDQ